MHDSLGYTFSVILTSGGMAMMLFLLYRTTRETRSRPHQDPIAGASVKKADHQDGANEAIETEEENIEEEEESMTVEELLAQAENEAKEGNLQDAVDSLGQAVNTVITDQNRVELLAQILTRQGELYLELNFDQDSESMNCAELLAALSIIQQNFGCDSKLLLPVLQQTAAYYFWAGDLQKAEAMVRRSRNISAGLFSPGAAPDATPPARLQPYKTPFDCKVKEAVIACREGDKAFAEGEFSEASSAYDEAIESLQDNPGYSRENLATLLHRRGRASLLQGIQEGYEDDGGNFCYDYQAALSILVSIHGFDSPVLLPILCDLAAASDYDGNHYHAETYLRMISDIERKARK